MWQKDFSAIVNLYFAKIIAVSSKSMMNTQRKPLLEFLPSMAVKMKKKYAKVLEVSRISKEISFNTAIPLRLSLISSARKLKVNVKCNRKFQVEVVSLRLENSPKNLLKSPMKKQWNCMGNQEDGC